MNDLIEALQIFAKYGNPQWPTHCEHDVLSVVGYDVTDFSEEDLKRLGELSFFWEEDEEIFQSFHFGSA